MAAARRQKIRHQVARAARGLHPGERRPLDQIAINRRPPRMRSPSWYRWLWCVEPDCGRRFRAGYRAQRCLHCARRRLRAIERLRAQRRALARRRVAA